MSPLDDQLRSALHGRAREVTPSPDPLAGIESRARGMKRRRVAASITGAALAVAAIAVAVPSISDSFSGTKPSQFASATPGTVSGYALDAAKPWAFRGEPVPSDTLAAFQRDWAALHPGSTLTPLFARVYEPSGQEEAVFVATGAGGDRYGVVSGSESGATFLYDEPLAPATTVLAFALEGDEVPRLLAVTAPGVSRFEHAPDGDGGSYVPMTAVADGVAVTPLEGALDRDYLRVTAPDGTVLFQGDAPGGSGPLPTEAPTGAQPANVLSWPTRGADGSALLPAARKAIAPSLGATEATIELKVLFAGDTDSGVRYVMGQAWKRGADTAHSFSYNEGGTNGPQPFIGTATAKGEQVLAFLVSSLPGTTTDLLVVIPAPRTTQVLYSAEGNMTYRAPADTPGTDGVVLIDRVIDRGTGITDHLQLLTGNGDPATDVIAEGPVMKYLCGIKECG